APATSTTGSSAIRCTPSNQSPGETAHPRPGGVTPMYPTENGDGEISGQCPSLHGVSALPGRTVFSRCRESAMKLTRTSRSIACSLAVAFAAGIAACHKETPTAPSAPPAPSGPSIDPHEVLRGVEIVGPSSVEPGSEIQFTANGRFADG